MSVNSGISAARHAEIFGQPDDIWDEEKGGRSRKCKVCSGWHRLDKPWPHNCREHKPQMQVLTAPMIMPDVPPHVDNGHYIGGRVDQREYMRKNGLSELEHFEETAGTHKQDFSSKEYEKELVDDIKRAIEEDPLNRPPPVMIEQANAETPNAEEKIETTDIEVIK